MSSHAFPSAIAQRSAQSLMGMAVVQRQLVMQGLDIQSLSRLASTCNQLRAEALHRESGKFIQQQSPGSRMDETLRRFNVHLRSLCQAQEEHSAHSSPLFRTHVPVCVEVNSGDCSLSPKELMIKAGTFARIKRMDLCGSADLVWTEKMMVRLLSQGWARRVDSVSVCFWLTSQRVQHALFALPSLTELSLDIDRASQRLLPSAVAHARSLRSVWLHLSQGAAVAARALQLAPALSSLTLQPIHSREPIGPLIWCVPPTLTELTLFQIQLFEAAKQTLAIFRSALKTLLLRLPLLHTLRTEYGMDLTPLLQGILDAGVRALPQLRRVVTDSHRLLADVSPSELQVEAAERTSSGQAHDLGLKRTEELRRSSEQRRLLRRVLHKFPMVTVQFLLNPRQTDIDLSSSSPWCAGWARVEFMDGDEPVDLETRAAPPSPHESDDESESDVDLIEEPSLSDEEAFNDGSDADEEA